MNYFAFSALVIAITSFILGLWVLIKNIKGRVNLTFALLTLAVIVWSGGYFFWQIAEDAASALFYSRLLMAGAVFIPPTFLHFVLEFIKQADKRRNFVIFSYLIFLIFFIFNFTSYFVVRVEPILFFPFWPIPGIAYHIFLALWLLYMLHSLSFIQGLEKFKRGTLFPDKVHFMGFLYRINRWYNKLFFMV